MQVRETNNLIRILPEDRLDPNEAQRLYLELIVFLRTKGQRVSASEYMSALFTLLHVYVAALMEQGFAQEEMQAAISRLWQLVQSDDEITH